MKSSQCSNLNLKVIENISMPMDDEEQSMLQSKSKGNKEMIYKTVAQLCNRIAVNRN